MFYPIVCRMIYTTWQCHANKNDERVDHFPQPRQRGADDDGGGGGFCYFAIQKNRFSFN